ncbi:FecR family protein [Chitinophaga silvatica]|uniref:FecR family protein n=1 Tax=Chitinophaga silvatica TaxID=2282649 RepID=A0A3E1Y8J0_9BACT|nr:FecR family protein [Chitinophaga silvatica]RFS21727.1 FecR family protein [Chitinophaga silvatica]
MKHPATLLEKFFRGECNEEEALAVKDYFTENPEALLPWLTEKSWYAFHPVSELPADLSNKMLTVIENHSYHKQSIKWLTYKWMAAAAAIVILATTGIWWAQQHHPTAKQPIAALPANTIQATPVYAQQINHTKKTMLLKLTDGSTIELAPQSQIKYEEPFAKHNRSISLHGTALFKVAPDKSKPFTVNAGHFGTTALGTVFRVTAIHGEKGNIHIQLISGKVIVKPDSLLSSKGIKATYLMPGQELSFDQLRLVPVAKTKKEVVKTENQIFTFQNEPLTNIFGLMSEKFKVKIHYQQNAIADMSFTGTFDSSKESLADFLSTISTLNNLTMKQTNEAIYITQ